MSVGSWGLVSRGKVEGTNDDCAPVSKIRFKEGTSSESLILLALDNGPDCREDGVDCREFGVIPKLSSFVEKSSREVFFESETRRLNLKRGMREMRISMRFGAPKAASMQGNVERIHFQRFINVVCWALSNSKDMV